MTGSMRDQASQVEDTTRVASSACSMTSGRGESSHSPIHDRQLVSAAALSRAAWRSTTLTEQPKSIRTSPSEAGSATHVTSKRSDQEELKSLLLEGWGKGWLAFSRPACACSR